MKSISKLNKALIFVCLLVIGLALGKKDDKSKMVKVKDRQDAYSFSYLAFKEKTIVVANMEYGIVASVMKITEFLVSQILNNVSNDGKKEKIPKKNGQAFI